MTTPNPTTRLDREIVSRAGQLRQPLNAIARKAGVGVQTLLNVRKGRHITVKNENAIEAALKWVPGSIEAIRQGGYPTDSDLASELDAQPDPEMRDALERELWEALRTVRGLPFKHRLALLDAHRVAILKWSI